MSRTGSRIAAVAVTLTAMALLAAGGTSTAAAAAPANDMIADAQVVGPELPATVRGTTIAATLEPGEFVDGNWNSQGASVWYRWTAPATETVQVDLCGGTAPYGPDTTYNYAEAVYTGGDTWPDLTEVVSNAGSCKLTLNAIVGTPYKIQVMFLLKEEHNFTLSIHTPQPPANDNFAEAEMLASQLPVSTDGTTVDATAEPGEPAILGHDGRTVWYSWTAPQTGQVEIEFTNFQVQPGSSSNHTFGIYTGPALGSLVKVEETGNSGTQETLLATVSQGTTYRIGLGLIYGGETTFDLGIRSTAPPGNDAFADAWTVGPALPVLADGDNRYATPESGEPDIGGLPGAQSAHSVWFRWTAPISGQVQVSSCSSKGTRLGVYTGSDLDSLVDAAEIPDHTPYCRLSLIAESGKSYVIAVTSGSDPGQGGAFRLDIHRFSPPPNDYFAASQVVGPRLPVKVTGNNADAGFEPLEPGMSWAGGGFDGPYRTVWYRWTPAASGPATVSACGSDVLPIIYSGDALASLTPLAPLTADELSPCAAEQPGAEVKFDSSAGTTYRIKIDGTSAEMGGPFTLGITGTNPDPGPDPNPGPDPGPDPNPNLKRQLKRAIKKCRVRFKVRGSAKRRAKMRRKRANCIRKARRKVAIKRCRRITTTAKRRQCLKRARKRWQA